MVVALGKHKLLDFSRPRVMGILNVTPDSFADGGLYNSLDEALRRSEQMLKDGVDIIDIGGESTRPGAAAVPEAEELDRVIPVVERLSQEFSVPLSIDSSKAAVMEAAVAAGACLINDINALEGVQALETVATLNAFVCLMHKQGQPSTMQLAPSYNDASFEVKTYLLERVEACVKAGITRDRLILDPGFGFGKTLEHNLQLLRDLHSFVQTGLPVLVGISRKSMLSQLLGGVPVEQRLPASIAAAVIAVINGARIVRVHDVKETVEALKVVAAVSANQ